MVTRPIMVEGLAASPNSGVALVVEKDDVQMCFGVEQRPESAIHLQGELSALFFIMGHEAEHDAAGDAVITGMDEISARNGRVEIEQNANRFLEPPLIGAILFADERDVRCGKVMQQTNLPSKVEVGTGRITRAGAHRSRSPN